MKARAPHRLVLAAILPALLALLSSCNGKGPAPADEDRR